VPSRAAGGDPAEDLDAALAAHAPARPRVVVGFSGGADSTLLLHLLAARLPRRRLLAVHVHHGWDEQADAWAAHCRAVAGGLRVRCHVAAVDASAHAGEGPEAAARRARYATLASWTAGHDCLITAHHRDDQAETLLLALLRGGGVHGWAGMPAVAALDGACHLRPWLGVAEETIAADVQQRGLDTLADPANENADLERAWLRQEVLPVLRARHPQVDATLARATGQAAAAADAVDTLAARDFVTCRGARSETLDCAALAGLAVPRQRALLRWWLSRAGLTRPPAQRLESLRRQLLEAAWDRNPHVAWPGGEARRWRGEAWALVPRTPIDTAAAYAWPDPTQPLILPHRRVEPQELERLGIDTTGDQAVRIAFRRGGEHLPRRDGGSVALKRWLAEQAVPPWERDRVPLVYLNGHFIGPIGFPPP
jgi:tRNA(Ile)-lysidine synthase